MNKESKEKKVKVFTKVNADINDESISMMDYSTSQTDIIIILATSLHIQVHTCIACTIDTSMPALSEMIA